MEALRFNRVRQVAKRIANIRRPIYPIIAPIAPNSPALAAPMMMPASSTPSSTKITKIRGAVSGVVSKRICPTTQNAPPIRNAHIYSIYSTSKLIACAMPGMLSPWNGDTVESSAPVDISKSRLISPRSIRGNRLPVKTAAEQPHPLPPPCTS